MSDDSSYVESIASSLPPSRDKGVATGSYSISTAEDGGIWFFKVELHDTQPDGDANFPCDYKAQATTISSRTTPAKMALTIPRGL